MNYHAIICTVLIINKNFQAEFESEGLRSQKISYYDNKKTVELLSRPWANIPRYGPRARLTRG